MCMMPWLFTCRQAGGQGVVRPKALPHEVISWLMIGSAHHVELPGCEPLGQVEGIEEAAEEEGGLDHHGTHEGEGQGAAGGRGQPVGHALVPQRQLVQVSDAQQHDEPLVVVADHGLEVEGLPTNPITTVPVPISRLVSDQKGLPEEGEGALTRWTVMDTAMRRMPSVTSGGKTQKLRVKLSRVEARKMQR